MNVMFSKEIAEEELKNKVANYFFSKFDNTKIVGKIDFCISEKIRSLFNESGEVCSFLWAEAKKGNKSNIIESFIQLILTIGKAKTFEKYLPPMFLGAFDCEKISFIEYNKISQIFFKNNFNWNITPSNHNSKEFKQLKELIETQLIQNKLSFNFKEDEKELKSFINSNFILNNKDTKKIVITKNNFITVYQKWLKAVKPTIDMDWEKMKKKGIIDADFYLADLLSKNDESLNDNLFVVLKKNTYFFNKKKDEYEVDVFSAVSFKDKQEAHKNFWEIYERPPKKEFWKYIIDRRDLLVPQDIREIKGAFFTPQKWVELSQQYLTNYLGENWQDEYYIWDCCAGTGNMEVGLVNKYNIFVSTLDKQDIDVIKNNIKNKQANLLESHVFQFDFLNDNFEDKLPKELLNIIKDTEKRKKLVIYINPPYEEVAKNANTNNKLSKKGISFTKIRDKYGKEIGIATKELFVQFLIRIYKEIPDCIIGVFSKLKILQGPNFKKMRNIFLAKLQSIFLTPGDTFDNVKGQFPIAFQIYDTKIKEIFKETDADVYDKDGKQLQNKKLVSYDDKKYITDWFRKYHNRNIKNNHIGSVGLYGSDFQTQKYIRITSINNHPNRWTFINKNNLLHSCIYLSVRQCIEATWLNDRDQFLYPNDGWKDDKDFQSNCLVYTLFHGQNQIKSKDGINNWIPFLEKDIEPKEKFESHFMTDYIKENNIQFTEEAKEVLQTGKDLYKYYHSQENSNPNASFYDIREYFQGRNKNGKMNIKSEDKEYTRLLTILKEKHKILGQKIAEKVYKYEFLL